MSWVAHPLSGRKVHRYELVEHVVTSGSPYAPDWHCSFRVFGIGRLCDSFPARTVSGTVRAYAERFAGHHNIGAGAVMAQAQSSCYSVTDRVLDVPLFELCHFDSLCNGCYLGSRQHDHTAGGWNCARECLSRGYYQGCHLFGCTAILRFDGAHSLGPSSCRCSVPTTELT